MAKQKAGAKAPAFSFGAGAVRERLSSSIERGPGEVQIFRLAVSVGRDHVALAAPDEGVKVFVGLHLPECGPLTARVTQGIRGAVSSSSTSPTRRICPTRSGADCRSDSSRFSPKVPGGSALPRTASQAAWSGRVKTYTARLGAPWCRVSAMWSPASPDSPTHTGPETGSLKMPLCPVLARMGRRCPTFTLSTRMLQHRCSGRCYPDAMCAGASR